VPREDRPNDQRGVIREAGKKANGGRVFATRLRALSRRSVTSFDLSTAASSAAINGLWIPGDTSGICIELDRQ
jgi:hypothetical protein